MLTKEFLEQLANLSLDDRNQALEALSKQPQNNNYASGTDDSSNPDQTGSIDGELNQSDALDYNSHLVQVTENLITAIVASDNIRGPNSRASSSSQSSISKTRPELSIAYETPEKQSAITTIGDPKFNSQVLLTIDPTKGDDGTISISFTTERSKTALGKSQGDHTILERLLLEFIAQSIAGQNLKNIAKTLHDSFRDIFEGDIDAISHMAQIPYPEIREYDDKDLPEDKRDAYKLGIRFQNAQNVAKYISSTIEYYNTLPLSTIAKDGHAIPGEGGIASTNMTMLRSINEVMSHEIDDNVNEDIINSFYQRAVAIDGDLVRGMKNFFKKEVIEYALTNSIKEADKCASLLKKIQDINKGHPVDPFSEWEEKKLKNIDKNGPETLTKIFPNTQEGRNSFFERFRDKCTAEKIGSLLAEIFDFPYKDNSPDRTVGNLHKLTKACAKICIGAFPNFETLNPVEIGQKFEKEVIDRNVQIGAEVKSWKNHCPEIKTQEWADVFIKPVNLKELKEELSELIDTLKSEADQISLETLAKRINKLPKIDSRLMQISPSTEYQKELTSDQLSNLTKQINELKPENNQPSKIRNSLQEIFSTIHKAPSPGPANTTSAASGRSSPSHNTP